MNTYTVVMHVVTKVCVVDYESYAPFRDVCKRLFTIEPYRHSLT